MTFAFMLTKIVTSLQSGLDVVYGIALIMLSMRLNTKPTKDEVANMLKNTLEEFKKSQEMLLDLKLDNLFLKIQAMICGSNKKR